MRRLLNSASGDRASAETLETASETNLFGCGSRTGGCFQSHAECVRRLAASFKSPYRASRLEKAVSKMCEQPVFEEN